MQLSALELTREAVWWLAAWLHLGRRRVVRRGTTVRTYVRQLTERM